MTSHRHSAQELAAQHILGHLTNDRPLFVALQGPQGSGKTFLSERLQEYLQASPNSLRVAVLSIDDLYLPHGDLISLSESHPLNPLWKGRGQPGTHDVGLGVQILTSLKMGNCTVELPRFDKSLFGGEGDRLPMDGTGDMIIQPPRLDVVILEGWFVGFYPISKPVLRSRWEGVWKEERHLLGLGEEEIGRLVDIEAINDCLKGYLPLWSFFDVFVQLKPTPPLSEELSQYTIVYKWRLQQEHDMKARNGGRGMSDAAVKSFVDRYIPGYVFFGDPSPAALDKETQTFSPRWSQKGLTLYLDENREVSETAAF